MEFYTSFFTARVSKQNTGGPHFVKILGPRKNCTIILNSGDMYSWSSMILISHLMFQAAYNTKKPEQTGMLQVNDFKKIFLFAILPKYFYDIPK